MTFGTSSECRRMLVVLCTLLIAPGRVPVMAAPQAATTGQQPAAAAEKPKLRSSDQLDSLVAPLALYPDPLLAQVLAASTYPLEIVQAQRWLKANPNLKGEELTKAAAKQPWDPSVQALVAFPDALKLLDENIQWATDLGNAFLEQQGEVMDAVQRMRKKAKDGGKLESSKQQKVEVTTIENKQIIEIKPADPQVIYVPSYNPTVVYGPPVYAYPPVVYPPPPSTGAVIATAAVSFGVGVMMGAMWSGCCHGGYGWGCGWGGNNTVVINNNFNTRYGYTNVNAGNRTNINTGDRTNISGGDRVAARGGNSTWQHNPDHRKSVPYSDRSTAQRFGGTARDASGRTERFDRSGQSLGDRGGPDRGNQASNRDLGGSRDRGQSGLGDSGGGQDRVGNRSLGSDGGRQSALGGSDSRARTEAASNRGFASSRESSSGGRGGSSRSGGSGRGGGGRRR